MNRSKIAGLCALWYFSDSKVFARRICNTSKHLQLVSLKSNCATPARETRQRRTRVVARLRSRPWQIVVVYCSRKCAHVMRAGKKRRACGLLTSATSTPIYPPVAAQSADWPRYTRINLPIFLTTYRCMLYAVFAMAQQFSAGSSARYFIPPFMACSRARSCVSPHTVRWYTFT